MNLRFRWRYGKHMQGTVFVQLQYLVNITWFFFAYETH